MEFFLSESMFICRRGELERKNNRLFRGDLQPYKIFSLLWIRIIPQSSTEVFLTKSVIDSCQLYLVSSRPWCYCIPFRKILVLICAFVQMFCPSSSLGFFVVLSLLFEQWFSYYVTLIMSLFFDHVLIFRDFIKIVTDVFILLRFANLIARVSRVFF